MTQAFGTAVVQEISTTTAMLLAIQSSHWGSEDDLSAATGPETTRLYRIINIV